ncbi:porin family protein [Thalassotalea fonticola]|uniref:Porin family protein n=1 Tax=Thalassotalea fonticola TaxID=3065649 RepID=A0ABZ0GP06_9GAMM|nr:porin family protein [Colwelliaceae bacterium S1-1]
MKKLLPVSLILLASTSLANAVEKENEVQAVESKGYIVGSVGSTAIDDFDKATGFEVIGGYNLSEAIALEASYVDFGSAEFDYDSDVEAEASALTVGVVGSIELAPKFTLMAKVGVASWEGELSDSYWNESIEDDGTDIFYGFGGEYKITEKVSIGARYTTYDMDGDDVTMTAATIKIAL